MTQSEKLTVGDAVRLEIVLNAAQRKSKVSYMVGEHRIDGIARGVGDENGNFVLDEDVRDLFLRITSSSGVEHFISVRTLMTAVGAGLFAEYDW